MEFVTALVGGEVAQAHARMTDELGQYMPLEKFAASAQSNSTAFKSLSQVHVAQSFLVENWFMTGQGSFVICATGGNTSMASPENRVFVMAKPIPKQAHVLVEARDQVGTWTFTLWLLPEHGSWLVHSFHLTPAPALDVSAAELMSKAREQQQNSHAVSAYLLYGAVSQLTYRGPNFQLGLWADSQRAVKELALPSEVRGPPPFVWHLGKSAFRIRSIAPASDDRKLALYVSYQADEKADPKQMEEQNRQLIQDLRTTHPEYLGGFDSIIAEAIAENAQRIRSVEKVH
jgi:hypothetical protein